MPAVLLVLEKWRQPDRAYEYMVFKNQAVYFSYGFILALLNKN